MESILSKISRELRDAFTGGSDRNTDKERARTIRELTDYIGRLETRIKKLEDKDQA